jgi:hypothetical protein
LGKYYKWIFLLSYDGRSYNAKYYYPSVIIDHLWHRHILDTPSYKITCNLIGGIFLHHCPENSKDNDEKKWYRYSKTIIDYTYYFEELPTKSSAKLIWNKQKPNKSKKKFS